MGLNQPRVLGQEREFNSNVSSPRITLRTKRRLAKWKQRITLQTLAGPIPVEHRGRMNNALVQETGFHSRCVLTSCAGMHLTSLTLCVLNLKHKGLDLLHRNCFFFVPKEATIFLKKSFYIFLFTFTNLSKLKYFNPL